MTNRENLLRAMRRQNPQWVPIHMTLCDSQLKRFHEMMGSDDYVSYFDLCAQFISLPETKHQNDYSVFHKNVPSNAWIDEWGVAQIPGSVAHFTHMCHPMAGFTAPSEVWAYAYPDMLADYRWEDMADRMRKVKDEGRAAVFFAVMIFEHAWYLRGLDNLLMDMLTDEDMAGACLSRMTAFQSQIAAKAARAGADIIVFGDDVGTQKEMMMAPELWRKWLKPAMRTVIKAAKDINPDVLAYYHSDGCILEIIPDLIEIGVDILNPIQPECMDSAKIKEMYKDRLSFWGTIGTQTTMPFGTPTEVDAAVRHMIETVGKGGGFVAAPTHLLEPEVPWENIMAFVNAARKYGRY